MADEKKKIEKKDNWAAEVTQDNVLRIVVNLDPDAVAHTPSKSGKTEVYSSVQGGSADGDPDLGFFLTVYRKEN